MDLFEFQAKQIMARYGLPLPAGMVAENVDQVEEIARALETPRVAVKAQMHTSDRFSINAVKLVDTPLLARNAAKDMLGKRFVTPQTGPRGELVEHVYVEAGVTCMREIQLNLAVDRALGELVLTATAQGGASLDNRARRGEQIEERLNMGDGIEPRIEESSAMAQRLGLTGPTIESFATIVDTIQRAFIDMDATCIRINPLAVTATNQLVAIDVKIALDDDALFRHMELAQLRSKEKNEEAEYLARQHQINFMSMDGNIGVVVNGAGLALATLDMIADAGGQPADFMDIRTTAKSLDIAYGIGLVLQNPKTRAMLINVYGGGMQACDSVVDGLGIAMQRSKRKIPIVIRLAGNNADFARTRLGNYGCPVIECTDMADATARVVAIAQTEGR